MLGDLLRAGWKQPLTISDFGSQMAQARSLQPQRAVNAGAANCSSRIAQIHAGFRLPVGLNRSVCNYLQRGPTLLSIEMHFHNHSMHQLALPPGSRVSDAPLSCIHQVGFHGLLDNAIREVTIFRAQANDKLLRGMCCGLRDPGHALHTTTRSSLASLTSSLNAGRRMTAG